jgi:hypothetical protein
MDTALKGSNLPEIRKAYNEVSVPKLDHRQK